ncbi:MAG: TonB-dependent receptor plug domain-containing protein [Gemmatimonadales bacterium]
MRSRHRSRAVIVALAIAPVVAFQPAGAQSNCAPATRVSGITVSNAANVMDRVVSLHGRGVSLREALDRLAAAARIKLSYAAEQLDLARPVCIEYESATVSRVLADLLAGAQVQPVVLGGDQVALAVVKEHPVAKTEPAPQMMKQVGLLDRVVVTGSTIGASQRALPIALDVVGGQQLSQRGSGSLAGAIDGAVPGVWLWEQSPLSLLARYGSIRGASSFGVSYPKVYVDGIEAANSLLVTHLDPDAIARIEVIRGPQGAALYGADAISGVMNIVTRQEGTEGGAPRIQLRSEGGASSSDYATGSVLTQTHGITLRTGNGIRSARLGMTVSSIGAFIPDAFSQQVTANAGVRFVASKSIVSGTFRFFSQDARTPSSPVLAGLDLWSSPPPPSPGETQWNLGSYGHAMPGDTMRQRNLDSLSRLAITDSSGRQSVQQFTVGATGTFTNSNRWTHTAVVGLDGYRLKSSTVLDGGFPSAIDSALRAATGNAIRTTFRASTVGQFGDLEHTATTITFGAEHSFVRDRTETRGPFARRDGEIGSGPQSLIETRSNAGLITQFSTSLNEKYYLSGGLRVERNSSIDGIGDVAMLPMLGAATVRAFGPATVKFRAAYGKGIRPPQTSTTSGPLMGLQAYSIGASLSPEEQSGIEAGADLFYGRFLSLHATRFDQRASGLIQPVSVYQSVTDTILHYKRIVYELQNVGEISNRGWELQGTLGNGPWSVGATFTQVDSKVRKLAERYTGDLRPGDRMLEIPARTLGLNASYGNNRWSTAWSVSRASDWINYDRIALLSAFASQNRNPSSFVGPQLRDYWINYNGVTRLGGRVGLFLGRGMTFTLEGENLLDEQRGEPDNVTVLPGRTVSAGLKVRF